MAYTDYRVCEVSTEVGICVSETKRKCAVIHHVAPSIKYSSRVIFNFFVLIWY